MGQQALAAAPKQTKGLIGNESCFLNRRCNRGKNRPHDMLREPGKNRPGHDFSRIPAHPGAVLIQRKPEASAPGDVHEREADRISEAMLTSDSPAPSSHQHAGIGASCVSRSDVSGTGAGRHPGMVSDVLSSPGQPLETSSRAFFEPRFGHDFSRVRIHSDARASGAARSVAAHAFTVGEHIVFGEGQYLPSGVAGKRLLAHELAHVVQQRSGVRTLQRRAANCPSTPPMPPTVLSMADFIALVQRVEADSGTKNDPIATARLISRTKYEGRAWDWLLPSTSGQAGVTQLPVQEGEEGGKKWRKSGQVTAGDIASLCFKLIVALPGGGLEDPMHVIVAIVADAETKPAGTGASGLSSLAGSLPKSVTQRGVSTWVGDVGKAAAEWMTVHPLPGKGDAKPDYMLENAPPHDLMADIDGVAMTSRTASIGFALDKSKPLSENLKNFFVPAKRTGRERRFHIFCSVEGFSLEKDGVSLTAAAKASVGQQVKDFADWYEKNDPTLLKWVTLTAGSWQMSKAWVDRAGDWQWFADEFIKFLQQNLKAEGP